MSYEVIPECKSGWLLKQSRGDRLIKNWRKRFVVLEPGKLIYYTGNETRNGIVTGVGWKGELNLENAKVFKGSGSGKIVKNSDKQLYIVAGTDERNLYLQASSVEEAEEWITAAEEHAQFATQYPHMIRSPKCNNVEKQDIRDFTLHSDTTATSSDTLGQSVHDDTCPEDYRFNSSVLKTLLRPSLHGVLLKTRDDSSMTPLFISIVSHPLCHNVDEPSQPIILVNSKSWYFRRDIDHSRLSGAKLGIRHYCEPTLINDGEPYVVFQVLVSVDIFHTLLQEIHCLKESSQASIRKVFMSIQCVECVELLKLFPRISEALMESHQVACNKNFSVVNFEEQPYEPYFVSPMEIIIGRSKSQKLLFFTNPENIIRNTETLIPLPGIIISVQGRGVVPPRSEKEDVNIIIKLHTHGVCDKIRDAYATNYSRFNSISSTSMNQRRQNDLNHTMEECSKAIFLWGENRYIESKNGGGTYLYNVTTNTTIIRLCKLEMMENRMTSSVWPGKNIGKSTAEIVSMYLLQSLSRFFGVKMSGYSCSLSEFEEFSTELNLSAAFDMGNNFRIIKLSPSTLLASPLFISKKRIRNDYDRFLDADDIDFFEGLNRMSVSDVYGHDSFSYCRDDVLFSDEEYYCCKLNELTDRGSNILAALEDVESEASINLSNDPVVGPLHSHKCATSVVISELPTYVLDYPMPAKKGNTSEDDVPKPAVLSKVQHGDKLNVFRVKVCKDLRKWVLIDGGWIPRDAIQIEADFELKALSEVLISLPSSGISGNKDEETVLIDCVFDSVQQKGKSAPFRRHFRSDLTVLNPFSYDKSANEYIAVKIMRFVRPVKLINDVLSECCGDQDTNEEASLTAVERRLNEAVARAKSEGGEVEDMLNELLAATEEDIRATEDIFERFPNGIATKL